jgi:methyl-accepting chemotaxis protein
MARSFFAFTVRRKIQLGALVMVLLAIGVSLLLTKAALEKESADPTAPLREMASQLDHFRRTEARALYASVAVAADDQEVEQAIAKGDAAGVQHGFDRLVRDMNSALEIEVAVILSPTGEVLASVNTPPVVREATRDLRSFHDALSFVSVKDGIEYINGEPYQVAAEPYNVPGQPQSARTTTGVILIGRKFSSILREFVSEHPGMGMLLAITHDSKMLALEAPAEQRSAVEAVLANRGTGSSMAKLMGVDHDVFVRVVDACEGRCARIAQIAVMRSRAPREAENRLRMLETTGWMGAVGLLAIVGALLLARWITRPIESYVEATEALAKGGGDLSRRLEVATDDELGKLAQNLNEVFAQIGRLAGAVKERAHDVAVTSEEIHGASRALLDGAAEQASRVQSTGAATTEMSASIQNVASAATSANESAKTVGKSIEDAVARMSQIRDAVERAAQRMALLGETNKRIGTIVDTIHTIADQTSLLALNAAIEAAHAGEHGRGFTVVADAVGQLATRVDRSAKEIDELIGQSRAQTEESLSAMSAGRREVEMGTKLITDSIDGIRRVLAVFDDTAAAVKEQAIASDEIARNMDAVGRIAQEVLVTSRQAVASGDRLTTIASDLERAIAGFKSDEHAPAMLAAPPGKALPSGT